MATVTTLQPQLQYFRPSQQSPYNPLHGRVVTLGGYDPCNHSFY